MFQSFFGRTYNNLSSISECKNNGECVINKKNRTSCKACRLRKCLVVGMSKSGSRYGRRSNWFKIHCLLQEQQQHHQHHQQQHQQHPQNSPRQPAGLGGAGIGLHFQQQSALTGAGGRPSLEPSRTPPPPWADVKHHLRLDVDNNNSMASDLNKDGDRLSVSAAAAAAAVVQAVRPELLRWPSPFFPAFPFPPPAPFFLALQPPPPRGHQLSASPASRSSTAAYDDDDDDDNGNEDNENAGRGPPSPPKRVTVHRDLPPVQDSPMDLSVSAATAVPPSRPLTRSPSPPGDGLHGRSPDPRSVDQSRSRRRSRRTDSADRTSGSNSDCTGSASDTDGLVADGRGRSTKNVPLDLTFNRLS